MKQPIKSNYFQFGKSLINRLICLVKRHEWKHEGLAFIESDVITESQLRNHPHLFKCTRCGKIKEEVI